MARTPLQRRINRLQSGTEQASYQRGIDRAANRAARAARSPSVGSVTNQEKRAIRAAVRAVRSVTTQGEAAGVRRQLRRKARNS